MSVSEKIEEAYKKALSDKNELEVSVFRLLKSAIKNTEIEKRKELSDKEIVGVLEKQAKQRRDSIDEYKKAGRNELAEKEESELKIIEQYLPEKIGEDKIRKIVQGKVANMKDAQFGQVMGAVMGELKGKADGSVVQKIVKEEMGK